VLSRVLKRLKRDGVDSLGPTIVRFRNDTMESVRGNWRLAATAVIGNFLVIYLILLVSLRFIGLSNDELPWVEILAAFALSQWVQTVIPISPGGLGIADAVLLACLSTIAPSNADAIIAALVLWRVFYWALPIPVGLVAIRRWKRENPDGITQALSAFGNSRQELSAPAANGSTERR
jgi:uncharacterized membrane protein YbhN (UPF0104 family)